MNLSPISYWRSFISRPIRRINAAVRLSERLAFSTADMRAWVTSSRAADSVHDNMAVPLEERHQRLDAIDHFTLLRGGEYPEDPGFVDQWLAGSGSFPELGSNPLDLPAFRLGGGDQFLNEAEEVAAKPGNPGELEPVVHSCSATQKRNSSGRKAWFRSILRRFGPTNRTVSPNSPSDVGSTSSYWPRTRRARNPRTAPISAPMIRPATAAPIPDADPSRCSAGASSVAKDATLFSTHPGPTDHGHVREARCNESCLLRHQLRSAHNHVGQIAFEARLVVGVLERVPPGHTRGNRNGKRPVNTGHEREGRGAETSAGEARYHDMRLETLDTRQTRVSRLGSQDSGLKSRVSSLGSQVSGLKSRVSSLGSQVSGLKSRVSSLGSTRY